MVNWDEAGKTWPQPHPHAARLLRGLLWGQQYCHSNPQCEGGMPGSLNPMCTYPDVLLYILLFPCCRVARILKRFVT